MDTSTVSAAVDHYQRYGYTVLRNVFAPGEIASFRQECMTKGRDVLIGPRDFGGLLLSEKIIDPLHRLLGPRVVYFGLASSRYGDEAAYWSSRHFHVDARSDNFDYTQTYPLVRVAIYLQDHDVYSGGLKLRPASWTRYCVEQYGVRRLIRQVFRERSLRQVRPAPGSINLSTRAGDMVIWNLRLHHAGYAVRVARAPECSFHPLIENLIPQALQLPEQHLRCVIFAAYGAPSLYLDRFVENRWRIPAIVDHWKQSGAFDPDIQQLAKSRGLEFRLAHREWRFASRSIGG